MKWTDKQLDVINSKGNSMLVSAGAGSGKTAVMVERIKNIIINDKIPVTNILVVTFTKASALDMKNKLLNELEDQDQNEFTIKQINDISTADIGTLHSFCAKFLRSNFYEAGIDPNFSVADETETGAIKQTCMDKLIEAKTLSANEDFFEIADMFYGNRNEESLKSVLLSICNYLNSIEDPKAWFDEMIDSAYNLDLNKNVAANIVNNYIIDSTKRYRNAIQLLLGECQKSHNEKYICVLNELDLNLMRIRKQNTIEQNLKAVQSYQKIETIRVVKGQEELCERVKALRENITKGFSEFEKYISGNDICEIKQKIDESKRRVKSLFDICIEFDEMFSKAKAEQAMLDFSDLEKKTLKVLKNEKIREQTLSNYKYVFVDEYQDTNPIQEAIIKLVSSQDNLFMVGDVKQSIYGFRLCEPQIFLDKEKAFKENGSTGKNYYLNENFRSHQQILEFCNAVFSKIMIEDFGGVDYESSSKLIMGIDPYPVISENGLLPTVRLNLIKPAKKEIEKQKPELELYSVKNHTNIKSDNVQSAMAEGQILLRTLRELSGKKLFDAKLGEIRAIENKDIVVMTRSRGQYLKDVLSVAESAGYSFATDMTTNLFDYPEMQQIKSALEVICNPYQDIPLFYVMKSDLFRFDENELAQIRINSGKVKFFYEAVNNAIQSDNLDSNIKGKIQNMFDVIKKFQAYAAYLPVDKLVERLLNETDFEKYMLAGNDAEAKLSRIHIFYELINGKLYNNCITDFLVACNEGAFLFDSTMSDASTMSTIDEQGENVKFGLIRVTTIHKSKGLEFPVVILIGAGRTFNRDEQRKDFLLHSKVGISLSSFDLDNRTKSVNLVYSACKIMQNEQSLQEDIRLFYVALTRAKNNLIIIGVGDPELDENKHKSLSRRNSFFDLLSPMISVLPVGTKIVRDSLEMLASKPVEKVQNEIVFGKVDQSLIEEMKRKLEFVYPFETSSFIAKKWTVSEIVKAEQDDLPIGNLLSGGSAIKGNAYHKLMQNIDFSKCDEMAIKAQIKELIMCGKLLDEEAGLIDIADIVKCLKNPLFQYIASGNLKYMKEQEFLLYVPYCDLGSINVKDEVLVQGVVDLVIFDKDSITVVDYKTNNVQNMDDLAKKYKRQLDIYAVAMEKAFSMPVKNKVIYSFALDKICRV